MPDLPYTAGGRRAVRFTVSRSTKMGAIGFERPSLEAALALATELIGAQVPRSIVRVTDTETGQTYEEAEILALQQRQDGRPS